MSVELMSGSSQAPGSGGSELRCNFRLSESQCVHVAANKNNCSRTLNRETHSDLDRQVIGKQSVVFIFDHRVTLASASLQPGAIEHRDMATRIADQAGLLKFQCRLSNAFAAHAEHVGDQFLSHHEFIP